MFGIIIIIIIDYVLQLAPEMHWTNFEGSIVGLTVPIKILTNEYLE